MSFERKDAQLIKTVAFPAAAASANTASIDLVAASPFPLTKDFELELSVPALPNLVEDKTVTITVQDSADDSSFAAIGALATFVVTGGVGNGAAATSRKVTLPSTTRRYVRCNIAVLTAGGDNTGSDFTMSVLI